MLASISVVSFHSCQLAEELDNYKPLYALDAETGKLIWEYTSLEESISSPILAEGKVIFSSNDKYIYAVDALIGNLKWKFNLATQHGYSSSAGANGIVALSLDTGEEIWRYRVSEGVTFNSPTIYKDKVFIKIDNQMYAFSSVRK